MEKGQIPVKSSSFTAREEKKPREPSRNLSLRSPILETDPFPPNSTISGEGADDEKLNTEPEPEPEPTLPQLSADIDAFLSSPEPGTIPDTTIDRFAQLVEKAIARLDCSPAERPSPLSCQDQPDFSLLDAVCLLSRLDAALSSLPDARTRCVHALNHTGVVLNHAVSFLEDEFRAVLDDPYPSKTSSKWTPPPSIPEEQEEVEEPKPDQQPSDDKEEAKEEDEEEKEEKKRPAPYPPDRVEWLRRVAETLCFAGYDTECYLTYMMARRNAMEIAMTATGLERVGVEDVQKMPRETLDREIVTWVAAFRRFFTTTLLQERDLCTAIFGDAKEPTMVPSLYGGITRGPIFQLMTFAEAVTLTKRSSEKLFKLLDVYEALGDIVPTVEELFSWSGKEGADEDDVGAQMTPWEEYKTQLSAAKIRLGEAAVGIFSDLEGSIMSDAGKTPVPGGAVHPLTRYIMNYLRYAGEYKRTLVQVFQDHQRRPERTSSPENGSGDGEGENEDGGGHNAFAAQLVAILGLLDRNMEGKAKLYKDPSLSSIFLMNNGRYMVKKIKGSPEIHEVLGNTWYRKRSSDLRHYHKSYQRETWGRVLACFRDEGLTSRGGGVSKQVLKERFKSFNAQMEEIHKAQSAWVVCDEQLQSELRVSVSAVVVPAYRSFLGRFQQYLDAGRQSEKYIKFAPEDLENYIDELFDGNAASIVRRRT